MENWGIIAALIMGITGSLHCAGMCGPIMMVMQFQHLQGWRRAAGIALYHLGRISVYALLGVILYSFRSAFTPQLQQYVSIIMGAVLLSIGIFNFLPHLVKVRLPWTGFVTDSIGKTLAKPGLFSLLMSGILNGLLPCGLVYIALSTSVVADSMAEAVAFMYAFGIGTMPVLVSITIFKTRFRIFSTASIKRLVPLTMFVFGTLFMLRGLNLGIPWLSPRIEVQQTEITTTCCHKH
jgi:sulfite exporter TauE/SafE